ncbi:hypothetical protein [Parasediminibacterium sp. JCM 36343]|uniref:hypothetical protein n=1 Tax=Parasediminibacterium sp. JCM 36343 TaxID=3374279 RepID=UPI00397D2A62
MKKTLERGRAASLFVNSSLTQEQVAEIFKIAPNTISRWSKQDNWPLLRSAKQTSVNQIVGNFYNMITEIQNLALAENRQLTTAEMGNIHKMASSIEKMNKKIHIGYYYMVVDELTNYIMEVDMPLAKPVSNRIMEFLSKKAKEIQLS